MKLNLLEFFRTPQFKAELVTFLDDSDIQQIIDWGRMALYQALEINHDKSYEEYEVSEEQIDNDIALFSYNLNELEDALAMKQAYEVYLVDNEVTTLFLN